MKKRFNKIAFLILSSGCLTLTAQQFTQTVRGNIADKVSLYPLQNVTVVMDDSLATETDTLGNFTFSNIGIGQHNILIKYEGYKTYPLKNVTVNSGKELILNIGMDEDITELESVVIGEKLDKNKPLNSMSTVSTRVFSVEETQKYAAAVNDPARMSTAFAGVITTDDGNNGISIRGNSPTGVLWRLEGVDVPNPNHFANVGTSGGGVSILSSQLLNNSDFSTGAFASEYGNALSGVFDLKLRKGNNQKREYTFRAGFLGLDAAIEGPFKKGYEGSYLVNYRYSTLGIISKIINLFDAVTLFQDLSYNVYLPTNKYGKFSLFGFNGLSSQTTEAKTDTSLWNIRFNRCNTEFNSNTFANGVSYSINANKKLHLKTTVMISRTLNAFNVDELNLQKTPNNVYNESYAQNKISSNTVINYKINARNNLRAGFIVNHFNFKFIQKQENNSTKKLEEALNHNGSANSLQLYAQWQNRLNKKTTFNTGLHSMLLLLNNTASIEPRASVKYELTPKNSLSFGYGLHSQIQNLAVYYTKSTEANGATSMPNKNLKLSKAHHFVVGYDKSIRPHLRLKLETYYQYLFNLPQGNIKSENFNMVNFQDGYITKALNSNGTGRNYGLELTVEHYMYKNFYLLSTASLYDSKYKGTDGQMHNTKYNGNFAFTLTTGKDFQLKNSKKNRHLGFNIKSYYSGGFRTTPIDLNQSIEKNETVYNNQQAFTLQNKDYFRTDLRISLKRNYRNATTTLALDIQNVTNNKNIGGQEFDEETKTIKTWYQTPLIPILSCKLEF